MKQYRIAIRVAMLCVLCALMLTATACNTHKAPAFADLDFTAVDPAKCTETDEVTNYVKISVSIQGAEGEEKVAFLVAGDVEADGLRAIFAQASALREEGKTVTVLPLKKNAKFQIDRLIEDGFSQIERIYND